MTWPTEHEQNEQPTHYELPAETYPSHTWPLNQNEPPVWPDGNNRSIGAPPPPPPHLASANVPPSPASLVQSPIGYLVGAFILVLLLVIPTTARVASGHWFWEGGPNSPLGIGVSGPGTATVVGVGTATSVPNTATPVPPTATVGPTNCTDISGFATVATLNLNSDLFASQVSFPPDSVGNVTGDSEQSGYQIRTVATCSPRITTDNLTANYERLLTDRNWQRATNQSPACTATCWQRQDDTGVKLTFAIDSLQQYGQVVTYNIVLAISPLGVGTASLGLTAPTYSAENDKTDLRWQLNGQIKTAGAALVAALPTPTYPVAEFSKLAFSGGQLTASSLKEGQAIGLQTNGGHFARLTITAYTSTAIKFHWIVYSITF